MLKLVDSWREICTFGALGLSLLTGTVLTFRETISQPHIYLFVVEVTFLCALLGINYTLPTMKAIGKGKATVPVVARGG